MEVGNMAYLAVVVEAIIALAETGKRTSLLPSLKKQLPRVKSKLRSAIQAGVEDGSLVKAIRGNRDSRRYGPLGSLLRTLLLIAKTSYKLGSAGGKTSTSSVARRKKKPIVTVTRRKAEVVRASDSATAFRRKSASKRKTRVSTSAKAPSAAVSNAGKKIAAVFWPGRRTGKSARKTASVKRAGKPATVASRRTAAATGKKRAAVARKKTVTKGRTVAKTKATTSKKVAKR